MGHLFIEIKRFVKKYIKNILLVSILLTVVFSAVYLFTASEPTEDEEHPGAISDPELYEDNAYFKFYVEDENQQAFTNTVLLNQYVRLEEKLAEISENTNTNLLEEYEDQKLSLQLNPLDTIPVIEIRRDNQSQLMTVYVRLENPADNMKIANYLYDEIANKNIAVLENKEVYLFLEPEVFKLPVDTNTTHDIFPTLNIVETGVVIIILMGLSVVLMIVVNIVKETFSRKLNFSFSYTTDESTDFNLYSSELGNNYETSKYLSAPGFTKKLLITQSDLPQLKGINDDVTLNEAKNMLEIDTTSFYIANELENNEEMQQISEIVIVVESEKTDRSWFNEQKKVASLYDKPIKILQINR